MSIRIKKTLKIKGMSCAQCEKIIQKSLGSQTGVAEIKASFRTNSAEIVFESDKISEGRIIEIIDKLGYEAKFKINGETNSGNLTSLQLAGIGVILLALYFLVSKTVGFNFIPAVQPSTGYGMLFVIGLLTSVHCIAMCGGINLSQCLVLKTDGSQTVGYKSSFSYNLGRVISYTIIGGIVGALGSVISFSGAARGIVSIIAGIFMVIMGINMLGIWPGLRKFNLQIPSGIRRKFMGKQGNRGPLVVGLLNGLMPCGPLQAMQLYALGTGSAVVGALSMLAFSLGTVPLMFGFGAISTLLSKRFNRNMLKVSAVLVILLGGIMLQRGLSLGGAPVFAINGGEQASNSNGLTAVIEADVQTVKGEVGANAYPEIVVQKGVLVKFNLHADAKNLNGCNGSILIPEYGIEQPLKPGDNIVEFMPTETGTYGYSCWMGMITSKITVVETLENK